MKKLTKLILKEYGRMSGEKKIKIALGLSRLAREVRKAGRLATGA